VEKATWKSLKISPPILWEKFNNMVLNLYNPTTLWGVFKDALLRLSLRLLPANLWAVSDEHGE
jgi:hypothetical protein